MMYHFRDRDALRLAIQEHRAEQWEKSLVEAAGKTADEAAPAERVAAYARVAMESATRGELELMLETSHDDLMNEPWLRVQRRWTPTDPGHSIRLPVRASPPVLYGVYPVIPVFHR